MDLDDDEAWTTRDGETIALEDMTPTHRRNLLAWLTRNAEALQAAEHDAFVSGSMPDADTVAFDMIMPGVVGYLAQSPLEWLDEQPLVIRLRELDPPSLTSSELETKD